LDFVAGQPGDFNFHGREAGSLRFAGGRALGRLRWHVPPSARCAAAEAESPRVNLEIGGSVEGIVKRVFRGASVFIDIGEKRDALLELGELSDGYPIGGIPYKVGDRVTVRFLDKDGEKLYVTMRSGDLARPPRTFYKKGDVSAFEGVAHDVWHSGVVQAMHPLGVFVAVTSPKGGDPIVSLLPVAEFREGFVDEAIRGGDVRVRVLSVDLEKSRLEVTMKDP